MKPWYMFPVSVPFGNPHYDSALGGSHDMDIQAPPNYNVTALLPGVVSSITAPEWGKQVGIKLDTPYNGVPYCAFLHLSAVSPALAVDKHVKVGDLIGWVGGANSQAQYAGTSNPTGMNFLNPSFQSSQVQVGFALMRGVEYGTAGWEKFPPIDWALDPSGIIKAAQDAYNATPSTPDYQRIAFEREFCAIIPGLSTHTGIANEAWSDYLAGNFRGPALTHEWETVDGGSGKPLVIQNFASGSYTWDGSAHFHSYK